MVDAAFTVIALPSAAVPDANSAVIPAVTDWVGVLSPGFVPLTMIVVPGRVVISAVPFPCSREDAVGGSSLHVDRAAAVGYRCIADSARVANKPTNVFSDDWVLVT